MSKIDERTTSIYFDDWGQGEPAVLLLPGWCVSRSAFDALGEEIGKHRRVLTLELRGHGEAPSVNSDFSTADLLADALALVEASGARQVIPLSLSHAGWVAIELRRALGTRVPGIVLLDWIVLEAPPPFLDALQGLQDPGRWQQTRDQLFALWSKGVADPAVRGFIHRDMGHYGFEMWARAGREIDAAYCEAHSPLMALAALTPPVPAVHLYAQPEDAQYLESQQNFATAHPWFQVQKLPAQSHFPMIEVPHLVAQAVEEFIARLATGAPR
ncbi:alpha/beta fold hydrolase [Gloeobacter morelensis]|uniref:Alpha/beta hydrolase n=1 Tax=Gloeobacter morelensis MG652769 TaxID=2781736 RepID=A0ABY3PK46_9CYAN|nr:alpha/beta hydrolase [Gloeobacter morelensis]UFP93954.1 alpha/beta hydrolase [Gloeobacter morelensis MG652769]